MQDKDDKEKAELEEARQANRETANAFHEVRQQRSEAYMKAFDHIKEVINPIYKDLTKSNVSAWAQLQRLCGVQDQLFDMRDILEPEDLTHFLAGHLPATIMETCVFTVQQLLQGACVSLSPRVMWVQVHPMGGTAYLSMVNSEDEPFLSGVSFTAMPPSKRWRQMEALSGGEKVGAALLPWIL